MIQKQVLAADFGASSGRVMLGRYDGRQLSIENLHRFSNDPVQLGDRLYWDFPRLFYEVKQGLLKAKSCGRVDSIGVDTWGVDYGLLDRHGRLLGCPVHYRDGRTAGYMDKSFQLLDKKWFYQMTGNQFMEINTAFQLLSLKEESPELLEQGESLLMMPDLFRYYLSGESVNEYSGASTTQLFHMKKKEWAWEVIDGLGLPKRIFSQLVPGGTKTGKIQPSIIRELGILSMDVMAVAGHDTQSALVAIPTAEEDFIFISCGTWSLLGTELGEPIMSEMAEALNVTNELGAANRYSFLKNIIGLWLIQESRRQWSKEGREYNFGQLEQMAACAKPLLSFIDPNAPEFVPSGDMPNRIRQYCRNTGQIVPETVGELVCCINQSLALTYRKAVEEIEACTGRRYPVLHIVGGGAQSGLLCQMTANACGRRVAAGPVEATVMGNIMVQCMTSHEFTDLKQAREVLAASVNPKIYEPSQRESWDEAYQTYSYLIETKAKERN